VLGCSEFEEFQACLHRHGHKESQNLQVVLPNWRVENGQKLGGIIMGQAANFHSLVPNSPIEAERQILREIIQNKPVAIAVCRCPPSIL
jgi:hypothetical protein